MPATAIGLLAGLVSGLAWALGGFGDFVLVLFLGALGYLLGRVREGTLDVDRYLNSARRNR